MSIDAHLGELNSIVKKDSPVGVIATNIANYVVNQKYACPTAKAQTISAANLHIDEIAKPGGSYEIMQARNNLAHFESNYDPREPYASEVGFGTSSLDASGNPKIGL